jgi:glycosyltransferase involved in cell wall biosynthesis
MIVSPWYPVPPTGYGGIELTAHVLARQLSQQGHKVTVIGRQGSRGPFESMALAPESWTADLGTRNEFARESLFLYRAYEAVRRRAFDVIHDHSGPPGIMVAATGCLHTPVVATLHGALSEAEGEFLSAVDHDVNLVAISHAQQSMVAGVAWRGVVHNAVDPDQFDPVVRREEKEDYIVEIARINPDKGQHLAIELARRLNVRLVLAGKVDVSARAYFEEKVKPNLNGQVVWRENVQGRDKAELLAHARALVFPIQWEEPFGLAMVEAMMSGTPVLALAHGAAPEVVDPGVTGFLADDVDGLVAAYSRIDEIDLGRCVQVARKRFGPERMAEGYLKVYQSAQEVGAYRRPFN